MAYEAAREGEYPTMVETLEEALTYVNNSAVSKDGVRPWIRDASRSRIMDSFLMIGGREMGSNSDSRHDIVMD